jgi:solute carrier family 25 protein 42
MAQTEHSAIAVADWVTSWTAAVVRWFESMVAGALAGAMAKTVIAPGDRVKIIFQADAHRKFSFSAALKVAQKIVEASGLRGLWTGHTATLLRIMPYAATSFTSFDYYKSLLRWAFNVPLSLTSKQEAKDHRAFAARFFAGSAAGATATAIVYPLDLIRARYAAHWDKTKRYPSYVAAVRSIVHDEGPRALYSGLTPTLVGIVPYSGITFCAFETLTAALAGVRGLENAKQLQSSETFVCGAVAGLIGQSLTYPLDIIRRRMQVHPLHYRDMRGTFKTILKNEGVVGGLFKGLSMNWIKGPISVGISFTTRDYFKHRIQQYHVHTTERGQDALGASEVNAASPGSSLDVPERLVCGGVAGFAGKMWTLPFDRIRIMYAVGRHTVDEHAGSGQHVFKTMRMLLQDSPHMWQGSGAMMMRVVPYAAISYTTFSAYQQFTQRITYASTPSQQPAANFLAGAMAATTATVALYPMDLMHARVAAQGLSGPSYLHELGSCGTRAARGSCSRASCPASLASPPRLGSASPSTTRGCGSLARRPSPPSLRWVRRRERWRRWRHIH